MKGIGVSSGVGIGKIYRIEPCSLDYTPHTPTDPLAESVRFHEAVEQFCKNTVQQAYTLSVTAGKEEAKILLGHINIVKDPYLQEEVEKLIQEGHCSEAAFECLCDKFVNIFTSSEDELTRQRAADIRDVRNGLLRILLKVSEPNLQDIPVGTVLCASEITPSLMACIPKENIVGLLTEHSGILSNSAALARVLEIPAVMNVPNLLAEAALILKGKPLYIRTLDIIGENEMPSLCLANEPNPLMGFRAIRYTLKHRDLFKTQLRAILRASAFGQIRIMFPLISCVEEVREGKALVEACKAELAAEQLAFDANIKVGIMTETAASGIMADRLAKECDFFTIGTDDLISYTLSADRNSDETAYLCSVYQPSVLRIIKNIIEAANRCHIPVSMCGEAAADPKIIPLLISFGLTDFTVAATSVLRVRKCIAGWTKAKADEIAEKVMTFSTQKEVENFLLNQILP